MSLCELENEMRTTTLLAQQLLGRALVAVVLLLGNPSVGLDGLPVLHGEVVALVVDDVRVHKFVDLVQIVEGDHRVAVVLGVEVGVPEQRANNDAGADAACVEQAVWVLGNFAVGVLEVAEVVDDRVSAEDWSNPPKENGLNTFLGLTQRSNDGSVDGQLEKSCSLNGLHDATVLAVVEVLEAPPSAAVVDSDTHGAEQDTSNAALEGGSNVKELTKVAPATRGKVAEAGILEHFARIVTGEFGITVNVVGVGVVLLVHDTLVLAELEAKDTSEEEADIVDPLGLERIAMKELVLARKGKALKLETVEKVERDEDGKLLHGDASKVHCLNRREDIEVVDGSDRQSDDAEVQGKTLETSSVALLHEANQDAIVEDAVALLALAVLDVGPVFIVVVDVGKAVGVSLFVEHLGEFIFCSLGLGDEEDRVVEIFFVENVDGASVGRHG